MNYASFDKTQHPDLHPIFISCKNGDIEAVRKFLQEGVDPYIDHPMHPGLMVIAIGEKNTSMIKL